uniref:Pericentrin n=1 Tax=Poecilia latipinna TaxID=48699 RepID=A0A3B3VSM1_9TELE
KKRAKSNSAGAAKKTQKGKGQADSKNDGQTQDHRVESPPPPVDAATLEGKTSSEVKLGKVLLWKLPDGQIYFERMKTFVSIVPKSPHLQLLQQAVEKRNEIIAKLSHKLQEALSSRDEMQLQAQCLAGQIQALQKRLQQVSGTFGVAEHHHGLSSNIRHKKATVEGSGNAGHGSQQSPEGLSGYSDAEIDTVLHKLMSELEEERKNSQRLSAELEKEMERNRRVLSLLEEEREEERKESEAQLQKLQNHCLVMQQYKEEKEELNREVSELRRRLQNEDSERRSDLDSDETQTLKEEVEHVRQLLDKSERQLRQREKEVEGLKAVKNRENHAKAAITAEEVTVEEAHLESGADGEDLDASAQGDILMERYLSSVPPAHSQLDVTADCSFELNSDVFGDQPLLSISYRVCEENKTNQNISSTQYTVSEAGDSSGQFFSRWLHGSGEMGLSQLSDQQSEKAELEKQLLSQLREELAQKERDLGVLQEEVLKSAEELEEARSRWAQVTEELQQALFELEEERERRRLAEEEMNSRTDEQETSDYRDGALMEGRGNGTVATSTGRELQIQTLQVCHSNKRSQFTGNLKSELEETKTEQKTTTTLFGQKALQDEVGRLQQELQESQDGLDSAERAKNELESQIHSLRENLACLEEAQALSATQREEEKRKEQQMDERIKKMEQVLEEELEQFENIMKAKDLEISELNDRLETELLKQRVVMEEEQKQQIGLIKEVTEREHERMMSGLKAKHNEELEQLRTEVTLELRESMEAAHQAEMHQTQRSMELEALRLSLTTARASQPATSQANVQQEQESAVEELQASMREKFAQESALLQAQHQSDLDSFKQQNRQQQDRLQELHQQEIGEYKQTGAWETEAETTSQRSLSEIQNRLNATQTELVNTQASLAETSRALANTRAALSQSQSDLQEATAALEELQTSRTERVQKLEEDLERAWADKEAFCFVIQVSHLQEEKALLKKSSEEEVGQLWTQLESMRASRQELGELKQQLIARSSQVDDIERLKTEFSEQKREIKELHEAELENLRKYFEKRLHASEETYKEEVALLQLRLVESALEESVMKTADDGYGERDESFDNLRVELEEKHAMDLSQLESSLALSYKEELRQVRSDLTDRYYEELQEMKTRHALELEQLRAKLSESHLQGASRLQMWRLTEELQTGTTVIHTLENNLAALSKRHEADHGEESLKKWREELLQEHENEISALRSEKKCLEEALDKEREKLKSLDHSLDDDDEGRLSYTSYVGYIRVLLFLQKNCLPGPQLLMVKRQLEAQYNDELQKARSCMAEETEELKALLHEQSEEKLRLAQQRFDEQKAELERRLVQSCEKSAAELEDGHKAELEHERTRLLNKHSEEMNALHAEHKAQLDSLGACHRDQLAATVSELGNKHKAELDLKKLEAAFKETSQAQLEALEAELAHRHQEERDELEKRMLGNMDTLEATYLKEVQVLRDEMNRLEEEHRQDLISRSSEHKQLMERQTAEQLSIREELKRELAQVHMDKFKAMAAELNHVHKMELAAQKETLDTEHCRALEVLKQQVLELEQQHGTALQELSHTYGVEKEQLIEQHQSQLQELRGTSARELDACRRELEEESARQRQRFQEEVELLKVQSEERLQDKINHLKTEFEERKKVELEVLRRSFTSQQQEKEQIYTSKMSELTTQLQQLEAVVAQLRAEIGCLQDELHGKRAEMETLDTLLQRRERESQEGGNLLKMLTDDLTKLYGANEKMSKVLVEMLRSVVATEELIGQKINRRIQTNEQTTQKSSKEHRDQESVVDLTSEEMELTQMLCESLLVADTQISPAGEESALKACNRLRLAVETLLDLLHQAHTQLEQTCHVHLTLEEKFTQGRDDATQLRQQHQLLMKQLDEEAKMKTRLQLELHKAEGLLDGYVAEKAALEESLQQKEAQEEKLVGELEGLKELTEEHTIVLRQKEHLSAGLGEREKALLAEAERLTQDRLDLQRQAEKDHKSLSLRLRNLERELEDQETKLLEKELQHKNHSEDLSQRVQALEKQLKHDRQFIEEQAVEREHERDEFQQEIRRLEAQLRHTGNGDNKLGRKKKLFLLSLQVESLQSMVNDKTDDHASLLEANQQAQRDLAERNEEIDKLAGRIRELEQALLNSAESVRTVNELEQELHKAKQREQELTQDKLALEQQQLSSRLQISALQSKLDETRHCYHDNTRDPTQELRDAVDAAQQNLHCKEQEVRQALDLHQKEVELKHLTAQLELLTNKHAAQVEELQKEISTLKVRTGQVQVEENEEETLPAALLQEKNQEIDHLNCEIQKLEQELESARDDRVLEVELEDLRSQVEHLQSEITRVRQEKQEEEERLHEVISTLQAELATLGPNLHEVSDSQDGDSINPSPSPSPEPHMETLQERRGGPNSLKHEISLTHSAASSSLRSRLKALQSQFETAVAEKEGLERLLLTQEEEYRTQGEEFGRRLGVEREKFDEVQGLLRLKETELEEEKEKRKLLREIEALKTHSDEMKLEMEVLREASLTYERQVQEVRAENLEMEKAVAEGRERIKTLETVKGELSAEREALRRRECQLQEEIQTLRKEVGSMNALIQELAAKLRDQEASQEEAQKEFLTNADVTLAKAEASLRQRKSECAKLKAENEALKTELAAVKQGLKIVSERTGKPHENGEVKRRHLVDLEAENQRMKAELERLQQDVGVQEEELAYQRRELEQLRRLCQQQETDPRHVSHRAFEDVLAVSRDEASLSSPEVLRKLECSEDQTRERFHVSVLDSRLSELSRLNCTGQDLPQAPVSPGVVMEPPHSGTVTPDPATRSTHSPGSLTASDHFSVLDSLDPDKLDELEELDLTAPPSPLGSTSSFSAQEWNSDGYGSNVSSELGARLRVELEQTERLDAQFVQYLRCRGINPTANTDSAAGSMSYSDDLLSPELQALLKKVYQESCRILTLSQRRCAPSSQANLSDIKDNSTPSNPPMNWQQEKRALQETVVALRELLCRMAQRQTQTDYTDDGWHRSHLQSDGHVESQIRAELEENQRQLKCAHSSLQEHKNKILSLRYAVQASSEKLKCEVLSLKAQVEQEKVACSNLRQELQIEQSRSGLLEKRLQDAQKELEDEHKRFSHQQELLLQEKDQLADSHRKLEEESRRHEEDQKFISSLRSQLEQERKQGEDLAAMTDKLGAELLDSRRKWEEDRVRLEELQREKEAAARHRAAMESLKEQNRELSSALEMERQRSRLQDIELAGLKERFHLLKEKEKERDDQLEKDRRKERQEGLEREMLQDRTNNKVLELELLRQQDQQHMQELQQTLADLEREGREREREMAAQKELLHHKVLSPQRPISISRLDGAPAGVSLQHQQLQRYYERYLRAESFRKALVYQKRYLILLLGGFQDCEQATLSLIARMGVRPTSPLAYKRRPIWRFRAVVRVVIAVSRMRFLTRKWQRAVRRVALSATINGHLTAPKADVLRQQQPKINIYSAQNGDRGDGQRGALSFLAPPGKSTFRLQRSSCLTSAHSAGTSQDPERSLTDYIHHLERVQQRLVGNGQEPRPSVLPCNTKHSHLVRLSHAVTHILRISTQRC